MGWLGPTAAFLWRGGNQSGRSNIDNWSRVLCDNSGCEVWVAPVCESFNDVECRPRITRKRDEWLSTKC